ncbi:hypothetical protein MTO96_028060 [Rhipicephalus appendiculatus]
MRRRRPRFAEVFPYGHKCGCLLRSDGNVSTVPGVRVYPTASRSRRICGGVDASSPAAPENEFAMDLTLYRSSRAATPQSGQYVAEPARHVTAEMTSESTGRDLSTTSHDQPSATTATTDRAAMAGTPSGPLQEEESHDDDPDDRTAGQDVFSMHEFYENLNEIDPLSAVD